MLIISLILFFIPSVFLTVRVFGKLELARLIVVFYLVVFTVNVIIFQALSLLGRMNDRGVYLALQVSLCLIISLVCLYRFRFPTREQILTIFHRMGTGETILLICIVLILAGIFMVGIRTAPNNTDSLNSHLLRIYYWIQHGSMENWTASWYPQIIYPINAHLQGTWLFLLGRSEKLFFLVQWFSLVTILSITYEITKFLGFSTIKALISCLVGLSFPVVLLQTYSFQGDLTVTALVMAGIFLFLLFQKSRGMVELFGALLSIALALGTKQTAFFVFPVLFCFVFIWLFREKNFKLLASIFITFFMLFLILSGYKFIQNQIETGSLLGNPKASDVGSMLSQDVLIKFRYNMPRLFYDFISFDGIPKLLRETLIEKKADLFAALDQRTGLGLETTNYLKSGFTDRERFFYNRIPALGEDTAWFGPLSFLLLPLAIGIGLFSKKYLVRGYSIFALIFGVFYAILIVLQWPGWDPYEGRYFILGLIPALPLVSVLIPDNRGWQRFCVVTLTCIVVVLAFNTLIFNSVKPILTYQNLQRFYNNQVANIDENNPVTRVVKKGISTVVFQLMDTSPTGEGILTSTRLQQVYYSNKSTFNDAAFILKTVPANSPVSIYNPGFSLEYGLFGENMTRKLFPLKSMQDYDGKTYLVLLNPVDNEIMIRWNLIAANQNYSIFFGPKP